MLSNSSVSSTLNLQVGDPREFRDNPSHTEVSHEQEYIVRLSDDERRVCQDVVKRLKGTSEKVNRAQILLKTDADRPGWPDARITKAYGCSMRTVENLRERLVTAGFDAALERKKLAAPPPPRKLDGVGGADRDAVGKAAGGV